MNNHSKRMNDFNKEVYPPSEDSWFLADFLYEFLLHDQEYLTKLKNHSMLVCEIGIGSGYISRFLCSKFPSLQLIGTDISSQAIIQAEYNFRNMKEIKRSFICTNLISCLNPNYFKPDLIIFNPPYVKTPLSEFERIDSPIVKSWAGRPDGLIVINEFLTELSKFTFNDCFFLSSSLNDNKSLIIEFSSELTIVETSRRLIEDETLICFQVKKIENFD